MKLAQRGNILFLILLAVVLFAALSYAVIHSQRGGGKSAASEKTDLLAAQLIQNVGLIEQTMMRAMLIDSIKEWGFDVSGAGSNSASNATCTTASCRIYTSKGGGVPDFVMPDWAAPGSQMSDKVASFYVVKVVDVGTSLPELILRFDIQKKELCDSINRQLGYSDISLTVSDSFSSGGTATDYSYTGTLTSMPLAPFTIVGDVNTTLAGKRSFCYVVGGSYYFMHVLI